MNLYSQITLTTNCGFVAHINIKKMNGQTEENKEEKKRKGEKPFAPTCSPYSLLAQTWQDKQGGPIPS